MSSRSDSEHPYLICHLSLRSADGMTVLDPISPSNRHFPPDRLLYGNLVSSPHYLRNLQGRPGVYFLFPDVSVRLQGRYVLQLTLMRLSRYASKDIWQTCRSSKIDHTPKESTHRAWYVSVRVGPSWQRHARGRLKCGRATRMSPRVSHADVLHPCSPC
jgi:hypothetical protein